MADAQRPIHRPPLLVQRQLSPLPMPGETIFPGITTPYLRPIASFAFPVTGTTRFPHAPKGKHAIIRHIVSGKYCEVSKPVLYSN